MQLSSVYSTSRSLPVDFTDKSDSALIHHVGNSWFVVAAEVTIPARASGARKHFELQQVQSQTLTLRYLPSSSLATTGEAAAAGTAHAHCATSGNPHEGAAASSFISDYDHHSCSKA